MELQPVKQDPVEVSERQANAAQGPTLIKAGIAVIAGGPMIVLLGAAGLFGVIPALGSPPIPYVLVGVGLLDMLMGGVLVFLGKQKSGQA